MATYWEAFLAEIRDEKIYEKGNSSPVSLAYIAPRELLECFYYWLKEQGQIKD